MQSRGIYFRDEYYPTSFPWTRTDYSPSLIQIRPVISENIQCKQKNKHTIKSFLSYTTVEGWLWCKILLSCRIFFSFSLMAVTAYGREGELPNRPLRVLFRILADPAICHVYLGSYAVLLIHILTTQQQKQEKG